MERTELIKAIDCMDQAMDRILLLPLIPPLAHLRAAAVDRLAASPSGKDAALAAVCRALPNLCGGHDYPLALPATLRRAITALCIPGTANASDPAAVRESCYQSLQCLRALRQGEEAFAPLLRFYGPEIADEERRAYREQLSILQTACDRQMLLYRCAAKAEAGRLRARYTAEIEETVRLLPSADEISRQADFFRLGGERTEEKMREFCGAADKGEKPPFYAVKAAQGGEGDDFYSGLEPPMADALPQPPLHGRPEIPAEPA